MGTENREPSKGLRLSGGNSSNSSPGSPDAIAECLGSIQSVKGIRFDEAAIRMWTLALGDLDPGQIREATIAYIRSETGWPDIGRFRVAYRELQESKRANPRPAEDVLALTEPVAPPEVAKAAIADIRAKLAKMSALNPGRKRWA